MHVLEAGLFEAVKESQLFAADPDVGLGNIRLPSTLFRVPSNQYRSDIENPDALRKYYDLLLSVIRVVVSTVFSRGLHNQQIVEQTRDFLLENRQSIVGVFKRHAKIGGLAGSELHTPLEELVKSYTTLIAGVGFLEVSHQK